jgi:hypothetical protein
MNKEKKTETYEWVNNVYHKYLKMDSEISAFDEKQTMMYDIIDLCDTVFDLLKEVSYD